MKSMTQQFIDWVGKQDPEATFDPMDCKACVGFQFLRHEGYPVAVCGSTVWYDTAGRERRFPDPVGEAITWACDRAPLSSGGGVTFGALADRLST